ncbi:MAG: hypothetical protein ACYDEN_13670 [Acidimicrobiales bacterium]
MNGPTEGLAHLGAEQRGQRRRQRRQPTITHKVHRVAAQLEQDGLVARMVYAEVPSS